MRSSESEGAGSLLRTRWSDDTAVIAPPTTTRAAAAPRCSHSPCSAIRGVRQHVNWGYSRSPAERWEACTSVVHELFVRTYYVGTYACAPTHAYGLRLRLRRRAAAANSAEFNELIIIIIMDRHIAHT